MPETIDAALCQRINRSETRRIGATPSLLGESRFNDVSEDFGGSGQTRTADLTLLSIRSGGARQPTELQTRRLLLGSGDPNSHCSGDQVIHCGHLPGGDESSIKEVIQPQVPLRLPCYDFTPVMNHTVVIALPKVKLTTSGAVHSHGVTGGVYKARERIHRDILIHDY